MPDRLMPPLCYILTALLVASCSNSRQLRVHTLPNYDADAAHYIMFLDFTFSRPDPAEPEKVTLTNAIVGNGEMKNMNAPVNTPSKIKLVRYFKDNQEPEVQYYEHPLSRHVEVAHENGALQRHEVHAETAPLSIRFQYSAALKKLELYSITPNQTERKLYTLPIKP